jgi:histone acetyltransferase (RNA polymerase elongator complex component)
MAYSYKPFIIPIFLPHAGCPHRCVFCDQSSITGVRSKWPRKDIREQIEAFLKFKTARRNQVQIAFFGGNFLGIPADEIKRLLAEAGEYVKTGKVDSIRFSTRPDTVDRQRLDLIKNFPVTTIELGVQSMDERVLSATNRGHSAPDTEKAIQFLKALNYEVCVQLMVGLPGDTPDSYRKGDYVPLSIEEAVSQAKNLYLLFKSENIRVIRMGLQASEDLENGSTILAGPYHPAFGHLVYSEIFRDMAVEQIESSAQDSNSISIRANPSNVSKLRGLQNRNIKILKEKFGFESIAVRPDDTLAEDQIKVSS